MSDQYNPAQAAPDLSEFRRQIMLTSLRRGGALCSANSLKERSNHTLRIPTQIVYIEATLYHEHFQMKIVPAIDEKQFVKRFTSLQDGASPHLGRIALEFLDVTLKEKWIGRQSPIEWPPRSPDLTLCDFSNMRHDK